jgi:hypothetical protein
MADHRIAGAGRRHLYRLADAMPLRSTARPAELPEAVRDALHSLDPSPPC